jgi:hypothetical protein
MQVAIIALGADVVREHQLRALLPQRRLLLGLRYARLAVPTMRLRVYVGERSWWKPFHEDIIDVERADPQARQLEHFCSVICGEIGPLATGLNGLQTLRVTLAIHEATRTEGSVHLPLAEYTGSTVDKDRS